ACTPQLPALPADKTYTFTLTSATGESLLKHTEGVYDLVPRNTIKPGPQPQPATPDPKVWTETDFLNHGTDLELHGDYLNAWDAYQSGLAKSPASAPLLKTAARLADHLWRFQEAATLLTKAEVLTPADP